MLKSRDILEQNKLKYNKLKHIINIDKNKYNKIKINSCIR